MSRQFARWTADSKGNLRGRIQKSKFTGAEGSNLLYLHGGTAPRGTTAC